jgi:hypothetical protein
MRVTATRERLPLGTSVRRGECGGLARGNAARSSLPGYAFGSVTAAVALPATAWSVQPTANPANAASQLNGLACRAPGACTAVGARSRPPDSHGAYGSATLAEAKP